MIQLVGKRLHRQPEKDFALTSGNVGTGSRAAGTDLREALDTGQDSPHLLINRGSAGAHSPADLGNWCVKVYLQDVGNAAGKD